MKRIIKGQLLILVIIIFSSSIFTKADFGVTPGTVYDYEVVKSEWSLVQGTNSGQGTGLKYGGNPYSIGTQFTVEVLASTSTSVDWEITVDGSSATGSNDDGDVVDLATILYMPYVLAGGFGVWDQEEAEMGPFIQVGLFFLEPTAFSNFFQQLHDQASTSTFTPSQYWEFDKIDAHFDASNPVAVFDWVLNAKFDDTSSNSNFIGTYYFQIAYDKSVGVLKGYNMELSYSGQLSGEPLEIDLQQLIEAIGFNMGSFYFTPTTTFSFDWLLALPTLIVVGTFGISLKKRRNK